VLHVHCVCNPFALCVCSISIANKKPKSHAEDDSDIRQRTQCGNTVVFNLPHHVRAWSKLLCCCHCCYCHCCCCLSVCLFVLVHDIESHNPSQPD
jgi:hypothetical protein